MGNETKSIAEQINFGNNYGDTTSPGLMDYMKSLLASDGGKEAQTPTRVPKKKTAPPQPVYKARGGMVAKRKKARP